MDFFSMLLNKIMSPSGNTSSNELDVFMKITNASSLFYGAKSFPTKAVVNLPNATNIGLAFSEWDSNSIPMVEEIIVNAPNVSNSVKDNTDSVFGMNKCIEKVVLNIPNETKYLYKAFTNCSASEIVLNFSTKNVVQYDYAFRQCSGLKKIIGVLDFSSATNVTNMFLSCTNLEEVTFAPNTLSISISLANSSKLSTESVQSIIDGLATVETAQNLTLHTSVFDKLTEEQFLTIQAKNWNVL